MAAASDEAAAAEHEAAGDPNPLAVDPDLAIWTGVVFLLLLAVLGKFAWPPIVAALEEREKRIADRIAAAEARHDEAKAVLAQHEAKLAAAADEVRELLEEARRDAEHTKSQIVAEARAAAQAEHERAVREVHQATDVAMKQLAESSAALAVQLASKVVQEELSPAHQERLVREAIGRLSTASKPTAS
jgi:F-type H+-transporting ATPase subunit b